MLKDTPIRVIERDRPRRWMLDDYLDLIIWYQPDGSIYGFQLAYDKLGDERALTWLHTGRFSHCRIDDGEGGGGTFAKGTPMLLAGGEFDYELVKKEFIQRSVKIDPEIRELVLSKLAEANLAGFQHKPLVEYYLKQGDHEMGPFTRDEIIDQIRYAHLSGTQLIRVGVEKNWAPVATYFPDAFPR
jgi:hypothetical protein